MSFPRASLFLTLSLSSLTLACGAKLPGGVSIPGGGVASEAASKVAGDDASGDPVAAVATGQTTPAAAATSAAEEVDPNDAPRPVKKELVAYYQKQDAASLYALLQGRRDDIYEKLKADVGRDLLWQSGNPDPTWIKAWKTHDWSYASGNAETLVQAAFNRTWEAACKAEFEKARLAHAKLATDLGPELAAVDKEPNHYARMAGYVALAAKFEAAAKAAGLDVRKDPFGPSGFRVTIAAHAVSYFQGSRASYAAFPWKDFALADDMGEQGRELSTDAAFELQTYCSVASSRGGLGITPFAAIWDSGHASSKNVAWPTVWGDERAVAAKVKQQVAATTKALTTRAALRIPRIVDVEGLDFADEEPKLAALDDVTVASVAPAGGGVTVTLTRKSFQSYDYNCKETRKIDRIEDDGTIRYRTNCKTGEKTYSLTATVTFAELPPGLTIAKGDVLAFTGDVVKDASKKVKDTPAKIDWTRSIELTGRILTSVKRGGKSVL